MLQPTKVMLILCCFWYCLLSFHHR